MATSNQHHLPSGTPGRHGREEAAGPAWTPDLPHPDWWVDGAQALGRDWPKVQGGPWDGAQGRTGAGRRWTRVRRQDPPLRLPWATLAAGRSGALGRPGRPEGPGDRPGPTPSGLGLAPGAPDRALTGLGRALATLRGALAALPGALARALGPTGKGKA
jgi:hypothetical protein